MKEFEVMGDIKSELPRENDPEIEFYDLLEALVPELRKRWEDDLLKKIEQGSVSYEEANDILRSILREREQVLFHSYRPIAKGSYDWMEIPLTGDALNKTVDHLLSSKLEENLLGSGAVAKVYRVENTKNICVKVVENEQMYRKGNTVLQESQFLETLSDFEVAGVRSPHFIQCFSGIRMNAIVMEEISGYSLEQIMNGDAEFPENFSVEDFFGRLKTYFSDLHKKNIFHLDIAPRNIMVNQKTGLPVVIDFGKSKQFDFSEEVGLEEGIDQAGFEATRAEVRRFLEGKRGI